MNKIMFISLGCDKNTVDTEFMLGLLRDRGYSLTNDEAEADVVVINSCAFIQDAQQESINAILEAAEYKKAGSLKKIVVAGCLAQRYKDSIKEEIPEVDAVVGTTAIDKICDAIEESNDHIESPDRLPLPDTTRVVTTGGYYAYLKIAEGCDKHCSYCIIPFMRGKFRSIPMERLVKEAEFLAEGGAKELILVAQETTVYGTDLYGKKMLHELLKKLCKIDGLSWIRVMYCYPEEIYDELIDVMASEPKICHYLDLPIQHASDAVLKRMGRRTDRAALEKVIDKVRKKIPDVALRTSLISGFPGETEEDHQCLLDFVKKARFERLGDFTYSKEDGTPAATFKDQVPQRMKNKRRKEVMVLQQQISAEKGRSMQGKVLDVIIEGKLPEDNIWIGRSYMDAPGVDGYVFVTSEGNHLSGDIIKVKITGSKAYDLIGEATDHYSKGDAS
ncbi:MAG: 30S ribosomal protein S12 methylthiotransferase RimO [Lachnospiraceae bacterium]|nr:30S ribosomal protein S12 methylthiotransferase RimO [Lachnospiraceae bacterium]